jgi:hypothetical protein
LAICSSSSAIALGPVVVNRPRDRVDAARPVRRDLTPEWRACVRTAFANARLHYLAEAGAGTMGEREIRRGGAPGRNSALTASAHNIRSTAAP